MEEALRAAHPALVDIVIHPEPDPARDAARPGA
jgi:hypothetical protein